ncbi:hypothetical protein [Methylorubrum extorquens]|uniref:hypothetical protein n=1 Tax=Methylorubrum extorquens TaxID=408 RepID=UPI001FCBA9DD|nr:hypothetical protein [Methylorubrum extorquens]MCP1546275.1 hypothetical protein [Methylorubrum extorquens]MCP1590942.1 hypothetical protein [Methylorubrum extorquens]
MSFSPGCPSSLPTSGRIDCTVCHGGRRVNFDRTQRVSQDGDWRITANPLAWGDTNAEVVVLGFSKGPTQAGELATTPHDQIAYKGGRVAVGKILAHVGLIDGGDNGRLRTAVDRLIADPDGRFHFGSLIRCTVERRDGTTWKGTGSGMLDGFVADPFGREVATNCARRFLANLPASTRLVVMFGMGTKGNYIRQARALIQQARPGRWRTVNEVAYADEKITFVHVEHFASQGNLLPRWLGEGGHDRGRLGLRAREAVTAALAPRPISVSAA